MPCRFYVNIQKWRIALAEPEWFQLSKWTPFLPHQCICASSRRPLIIIISLSHSKNKHLFFSIYSKLLHIKAHYPISPPDFRLEIASPSLYKTSIATSLLFLHNPCNSAENQICLAAVSGTLHNTFQIINTLK